MGEMVDWINNGYYPDYDVCAIRKLKKSDFPKHRTYSCKYYHRKKLSWLWTDSGWKLFEKNGQPHIYSKI